MIYYYICLPSIIYFFYQTKYEDDLEYAFYYKSTPDTRHCLLCWRGLRLQEKYLKSFASLRLVTKKHVDEN